MKKGKVKNILVTGKPGAGKTTLVKSVIRELPIEAGGFFTEEIREGRERKGFRICSLEGDKGLLAYKGLESPFKVGSYGVNLVDLEKIGVTAVLKALRDKELIVIDEIGRMELYSLQFKKAVLEALESSKPVLATIKIKPSKFTQMIEKRSDVLLFRLTLENRKKVKDAIKKILLKI